MWLIIILKYVKICTIKVIPFNLENFKLCIFLIRFKTYYSNKNMYLHKNLFFNYIWVSYSTKLIIYTKF